MLTACVLLLVCAAIAAFVWAARRTVRLNTTSEPTPEEARIHLLHEKEREKIAGEMPSGAVVREMSNDELEKLANDRTSLTPVPVRGSGSDSSGSIGG